MALSRRAFLASLTASLACPPLSFAKGSAKRRFVFVWNAGGWDPLCVFAPKFGLEAIDMDPLAEPWTVGNLALIDHPGRPAVRSFFEDWHQRSVVLNGISVPSVSHEICTLLATTGSSGGERSDWSSLLADSARDEFSLPSLVLAGPSFPGDRGLSVARVGLSGQLQALLGGYSAEITDLPVGRSLGGPSRAAVDRFVLDRAAARADRSRAGADERLAGDLRQSLERAQELVGRADTIAFGESYDLRSQVDVALRALGGGLSRCVSLQSDGVYGASWDTHDTNHDQQTAAFDGLFGGLSALMTGLNETLDPEGAPLADTTTVVVFSEMGRTPKLNGAQGRDHWPYTTMLLLGAGLRGGTTVGAYDDTFYGAAFDPDSGEVLSDGPPVTSEAVGATLLALADIDPGELLPQVQPITAVLA